MKSLCKNLVGRGPRAWTGPDRRSRRGAAGASAEAGFAGGDRGGQGNSGDEERERDVCERRSQHRPADQGRAAADQPQLSKGPQRGRRDRRPEACRPREGNRRWHGDRSTPTSSPSRN